MPRHHLGATIGSLLPWAALFVAVSCKTREVAMPATQVTYSTGVRDDVPDSSLAALAMSTDTTSGAFFKFQAEAIEKAVGTSIQPQQQTLQFELGALGVLQLQLQDDARQYDGGFEHIPQSTTTQSSPMKKILRFILTPDTTYNHHIFSVHFDLT